MGTRAVAPTLTDPNCTLSERVRKQGIGDKVKSNGRGAKFIGHLYIQATIEVSVSNPCYAVDAVRAFLRGRVSSSSSELEPASSSEDCSSEPSSYSKRGS